MNIPPPGDISNLPESLRRLNGMYSRLSEAQPSTQDTNRGVTARRGVSQDRLTLGLTLPISWPGAAH